MPKRSLNDGPSEGSKPNATCQTASYCPRARPMRPRMANSLGLLTKNFLDLIAISEGGSINLNFAARRLNIPKRRIYDITNVLEGIGLIQKCSKNIVKWMGDTLAIPEVDRNSLEETEMELRWLKSEERFLNAKIAFMRESIIRTNQMPDFQKECFLVPADLREIRELQDSHVFSVKGSQNVSFFLPEAGDTSQHKIFINGCDADLDVCVLNTATTETAVTSECKEATDHAASTGIAKELMSIDSTQDQGRTQTEDVDLGDIHALCQAEVQSHSED